MSTEEANQHLTATIVGSYVRHNRVGANQLPDLITTVHYALGHLGQPIRTEEVLTPAVSARRSVHDDYVICMHCGFRAVTLRRHLRVRHGLSPDEYLRRWGLKSNHPLTAPAYSERRSMMAKAVGLGRKAPADVPVGAPKRVIAEPQSQLKRKPRTGRISQTADVTSVAVAPTPARRGRPRSRAGAASQP